MRGQGRSEEENGAGSTHPTNLHECQKKGVRKFAIRNRMKTKEGARRRMESGECWRWKGSGQREALLSSPGAKTRAPYHKRYWLSRITMLLFEWASLFETVGYKLAERKGLREGWDSKELW